MVSFKEHVDKKGADDKQLKRHREQFRERSDIEVGCKVLSQCYGKP